MHLFQPQIIKQKNSYDYNSLFRKEHEERDYLFQLPVPLEKEEQVADLEA